MEGWDGVMEGIYRARWEGKGAGEVMPIYTRQDSGR